MRVLVISRSAWRNDNSTGNTLSDFFSDIPDAEIFSLCMREQVPQNNIAKRHFYISEKQLIKRLLGKKIEVGAEHAEERTDDGSEKAVYDKLKKHPNYLLHFGRELLWSVGSWKNENLRRYIREINPDIIFFPTFGCYYPQKILSYIHSLTDAKIVLFHADDHYTLKQFSLSPLFWLYRFGLRKWMQKTVSIADLQYCISSVQKADYDKAFNCECKIMTKFGDFSSEPQLKDKFNWPMQLVFTGNINVNRWKSLQMLVKVLERINEHEIKAQLRIYTATPMTEKMIKALDVNGSSFLMGTVSSSEIPEIQRSADILVHVESNDLKNRLLVRQSFSTKLVDYFKAARPIIAVGPKEVASIKHLIDNDAAIVADSEHELYEKLTFVFNDSLQLQRFAENAYMCGRNHHDNKQQKTMLQHDLNYLTNL